MDGFYRLVSRAGIYFFIIASILILPNLGFAATETLEMVPPVSGSAHFAGIGVTSPSMIMNSPLSTYQYLGNLMDNDPNTFYQPTAGSNGPTIGSDVLLRFEFPEIPDRSIIESVTLAVGISSTNTDAPFLRGFGFLPYSRLDLTTYLNVDLGPGIQGVFPVSPETPVFPFPRLK